MSRPTRLLAAAAAAASLLAAGATASPASAATTWLCKPGLASNPCRTSLTTTIQTTGRPDRVVKVALPKAPAVDCFYVYPTVSAQAGPNADLTIDPAQKAIAGQQASRFSSVCRVFAPMYPQLTLSAIGKDVEAGAIKKAYAGVEAAWKEYLRKDNEGRPVVLIGHSQGTGMLTQLIHTQIDRKPAVRKQLVSAILLGGNVLVPKGKDVGGSFAHVPACRRSSQTGCVIAYSTFGATPPADAVFGRSASRFASVFGGPSGSRYEVLCTNPGALGGGSAVLDTYAQTAVFPGALGALLNATYGGAENAPTAATPWVRPSQRYSARCSTAGGADVLRLTPVGDAPVLTPEPAPTWGLHLVDVNIALGQLTGLVRKQTAAHLRADR